MPKIILFLTYPQIRILIPLLLTRPFQSKLLIDTFISVERFTNCNSLIFAQSTDFSWWAENAKNCNCFCYFSVTHSNLPGDLRYYTACASVIKVYHKLITKKLQMKKSNKKIEAWFLPIGLKRKAPVTRSINYFHSVFTENIACFNFLHLKFWIYFKFFLLYLVEQTDLSHLILSYRFSETEITSITSRKAYNRSNAITSKKMFRNLVKNLYLDFNSHFRIRCSFCLKVFEKWIIFAVSNNIHLKSISQRRKSKFEKSRVWLLMQMKTQRKIDFANSSGSLFSAVFWGVCICPHKNTDDEKLHKTTISQGWNAKER